MIRVEVPIQNDLCGVVEITPGETSNNDNSANDTNNQRNDTSVNDGGSARRKKRAAGTAPVPQSALVTVMERDEVKASIRAVSSLWVHLHWGGFCHFTQYEQYIARKSWKSFQARPSLLLLSHQYKCILTTHIVL